MTGAGSDLGRMHIVMRRRPPPGQLTGLRRPVLVIVAGQSRAHDPDLVARHAHDWLPQVTTVGLPQASHHSIPTEDAHELLRHIAPFLIASSQRAGSPGQAHTGRADRS